MTEQPGNDGEHPEVTEKQVVLLGLIAEEPIHAYGLEEKIRERRMDQWTEIGFSSIYRVLRQLQDQGLIETELRHEGQGATRKVHRINPAGRAALARGVLERVSGVRPLKNPFQVALAYLVHAPYAEAVARLEQRRDEVVDVLEQIVAIEQMHSGGPLPDEEPSRTQRRQTCVHLMFDHMRHHIEAEQRFIEAALRFLEEQGDAAFAAPEDQR